MRTLLELSKEITPTGAVVEIEKAVGPPPPIGPEIIHLQPARAVPSMPRMPVLRLPSLKEYLPQSRTTAHLGAGAGAFRPLSGAPAARPKATYSAPTPAIRIIFGDMPLSMVCAA
jgi:hypothetical protein